MKKAVCLITYRDGKLLGVSRKNKFQDMNFCGGKIDDTDSSPEDAMIREAKEETGLDIFNLKLVDVREYDGYEQYCFTADNKGEINYDKVKEPHLVKWVDNPDELLHGSFKDYNITIFQILGII